jgi:serine/threonine protein kinase
MYSQLLLCVRTMHAHGIVHRDLKPENVIFGKTVRGLYHLKIVDFGLSLNAFSPSYRRSIEEPVGTIPYMAPELLKRIQGLETSDTISCKVRFPVHRWMRECFLHLGRFIQSGCHPVGDGKRRTALCIPRVTKGGYRSIGENRSCENDTSKPELFHKNIAERNARARSSRTCPIEPVHEAKPAVHKGMGTRRLGHHVQHVDILAPLFREAAIQVRGVLTQAPDHGRTGISKALF